ncbi:SDR family oxidoreductase [Microbacterium invictum]|uniref:NAD(P)-dependent dehydrogenase (Short-subunit alcohol dehydrogenase family) n=1 Tax=Microbacterium invictum TaxID=515415 RepID=A0AA40VP22_9MICO|nr:SDR family oxidoreductase [Microbacterium invictum]MBB4141422.1 NAD(P)-dependent dehydrogenase (short-subunit alcohol dehydrogenase family) [Microbacterium invictum]
MPHEAPQTRTDDWLGLSGARVLVAGAGGIGGACAAAYARAGAHVAVVDHDRRALDALATTHPDVTFTLLEADLTAHGAGEHVVTEVIQTLGGLEVLLHAVGMNDRRPILEFTEDEWEKVMQVNLFTVFGLAQAAGRHMVAQGHGRILALSSVSGLLAHHSHGPYAASKGGINQLLRVMAREWAESGVTVNALAPGYIETPLTSGELAKPGKRASLEGLVPAGRLGTPDEVTGPALFLSSVHAGFVTGHVMYIDGGRTLV